MELDVSLPTVVSDQDVAVSVDFNSGCSRVVNSYYDLAGGSLEPGGLQHSGAEGVVVNPAFSIFLRLSDTSYAHPEYEVDVVSLQDTSMMVDQLCLPDLETFSAVVHDPAHSTCFDVGAAILDLSTQATTGLRHHIK